MTLRGSEKVSRIMLLHSETRTSTIATNERLRWTQVIELRRARPVLSLPDKFRLERHRAKPVDLAVDVVIAFGQADTFHLCPCFDRLRRTFDGKIFDDHHSISVGE